MYNIQLLNKIAKVGTAVFDTEKFAFGDSIENPDAIMVRSAVMHDMEFGKKLKAIARAGAGVNNIPLDRCAEEGIVVFNTPGANANGVKELAAAALLLASRNIAGGIQWVQTLKGTEDIAKQIEKGKSRFAGCEIKGKTLGVIGLGAIGGLVANMGIALGMNVIGCDPYLTVENAWSLSRSVVKATSFDEIYAKADYITLHVPATKETTGMLSASTFAKMKDGVRIINLARAELVDSTDLIAGVQNGKIAAYVTDFATDDIVGVDERITVIPHLGASTEESEDNCAVMAAEELVEFLENGNVRNSVNYPSCSMPRAGDTRLCVLHRNQPGVINRISSVIADEKLNIENMLNRSRGSYSYVIIDLNGDVPEKVVTEIGAIENVIRVNRY
ncbi:MAG: phosphoglycerate dehydrogenase [Lachnospiraceae bacterium]|nr:phosphoglycerate dehydrogenase [Lachnospiraceae bacterium]